VMPREFARREAEIEGAASAFYWQGKLHVFNRDQMRVRGDFPARRPGVFRIVTVGDSLTYGKGIAEEDTYSRVLERELQGKYEVEVLNLGVSASQSEGILDIVKKQVPRLEPDLVFYGVCLNDFLPSHRGEYTNNYAYRVPFPYKVHLTSHTLIGNLIAERYNDLLMKLGLRADFVTDILRDFKGYQVRFGADVAEMNAYVRSRGLPPVVTMVLYQFPDTRSKAQEIVLLAEQYLREAGMRVVSSDYLREHDGRKDLHLNRWESHPNEEANRIFAREIAKVIAASPRLQPYGKKEQ
jgi:lysophospholipase L1-like esterase